jgi:hypothetical protein
LYLLNRLPLSCKAHLDSVTRCNKRNIGFVLSH